MQPTPKTDEFFLGLPNKNEAIEFCRQLERQVHALEQWKKEMLHVTAWWQGIADFVREDKELTIGDDIVATTAQFLVEHRFMRLILLNLASAWAMGGWKAESQNEREIEILMETIGFWPMDLDDIATCRPILTSNLQQLI